jgi:hypothetical protein
MLSECPEIIALWTDYEVLSMFYRIFGVGKVRGIKLQFFRK